MDWWNKIDGDVIGFLLGLTFVFVSAAILLASRGYPAVISRSILIFCCGRLLMAVDFFLLAFRATLPAVFSVVIAHPIGLVGLYTSYAAARELQGKPHGWKFPLAVGGAVLGVTTFFWKVWPVPGAGIAFVAAMTGFLVATTANELLRSRSLPGRGRLISGVWFALFAFVAFVRAALIVWTIIHPRQDGNFDWSRDWYFVLAFLGGTMAMPNFILMCNDVFNSELRRLAATDALSGLGNRRWLFERGEDEISRSGRYGRDCAVLVIDIDHFKRINDGWGHAAGDRVIKAVAGTLAGALRQIDLVGRLGGEEFAVILPETSPRMAVELADRLRLALAALCVDDGAGKPLPITASIGVANYRGAESFSELLGRADLAMYEAKKAGRNRVVAARPDDLVAAD